MIKFLKIIFLLIFVQGGMTRCEIPAIKVKRNSHLSAVIVSNAQLWLGKHYNENQGEQCANFVREVLAVSCNKNFSANAKNPIQAKRPWDAQAVLKKVGNSFGPSLADSLAGDEVGIRVSLKELMPGDLIFLERTYGDYGKGVITHVGIYAGDGEFIDRSTSGGPIKQRAFNKDLFYGALRLHNHNCK